MISFYLDESGDFGHSNKSSKYLILALLVIKDPLEVSRCIRKTKKIINRNRPRNPLSELKFCKLKPHERIRVIKKIIKKDFMAHLIILKKDTVTSNIFDKPEVLYRYLCNFITGKAIYRSRDIKFKIYIDRFLSKRRIKRFNKYFIGKSKHTFPSFIHIELEHVTSHNELCIQAADIVAGATFSKYEWKRYEYYNLLKEKISTENNFFK